MRQVVVMVHVSLTHSWGDRCGTAKRLRQRRRKMGGRANANTHTHTDTLCEIETVSWWVPSKKFSFLYTADYIQVVPKKKAKIPWWLVRNISHRVSLDDGCKLLYVMTTFRGGGTRSITVSRLKKGSLFVIIPAGRFFF